MTTYFEKVASDFGNELSEEILKVASEEINEMQPEDVLSEYLEDLSNAGYDISNLTMDDINMQGVYDYGVSKAAEYISEDIDKVAGGESVQYQTAAAAKAVAPFLTNDGVANLGSAFGMGNGPIGSVVNANTDKNVFGGWGTLIGQNNVNPNAVSAEGKVNSLLGSTNMKFASEEEMLYAILDKTASDFEQTVDEFVTDLAIEAIEAQYDGQKVATALSGYSVEDLVVEDIEKSAAEFESTPEDFLLALGLDLAQEYVKEASVMSGGIGPKESFAKQINEFGQKHYIPMRLRKKMLSAAMNPMNEVRDALKKMETKTQSTQSTKSPLLSDKTKKGLMYGGGGALLATGLGAGLYKALQNKKKEKEEEKEASAPEVNILEFAKAKLLGSQE